MPESRAEREKILGVAHAIERSTHKEPERGFRVIITGKGGVGKTTITALLSHLLSKDGFTLLAVDEDPQMNLPYALGVPKEQGDAVVPLTKNLDYVEEKTGARPGAGWGSLLRLNPDVSDVVERFGIKGPGGISILVMGTVVAPATGCLCPENALLEAIVRYINLREREVILMDTQAGVEHFGRSLAQGFDQAVLVTDPTFNAVQVALHAARLARALGIPTRHLVINRVRSENDIKKVRGLIAGSEDLFTDQVVLPYDEQLIECEPGVEPLLAGPAVSPFVEGVRTLKATLVRFGTP
ncbi:AAA family ATPase [Methanoregula sp.]|jgi:CO dehydrogenase maturation factor|uniref:ATP-binding protein n=1 Tax=Methanoregula sp. TaxID=2052170 RepID=UPI0025CE292C|nr:AAA family ATPase [Methanoregula sp.]